ncbi:phage holin family protein [Actinoplanes sp. NPDC023936]|uniref:phage holin family protein n=1 Tax=Actinoplanes sp. NPDC023936 TaxID=3154910 RepID=UPI003405C463
MPSIVVTVILSTLALGATVVLMPGISAENGWAVLGAAIILGLLGALLRPLLVRLLSRVGWAGVVAGWLVTQALLVWGALWLAPDVHVDGFWSAFAASWLGAALMSIGLWVVTAGQSGPATQHLLRVNRRFRKNVARTETPGVVMIQIDGLSAPLARWAIEAGNLPTLGRWLRSGSHALTEWHAQLPATTPASQAGLLHGASDQIPAFRWYEKSSARLVVTNRPKDSALVESRCSDGRGLLAGGGVSVSNVFSGDAGTSLLTMSTAGSAGPSRYLGAYLIDPYGLTRSLILTVGEIVKELYQARRQRLRDVRPRMRRRGSYVFLRGATNVLLRHLNLAIITEQMMQGAPSIYCDFVDYDEIAHHAGPARPESLASLEGIDGVLATLEEVAAAAPRPYLFVVLSDHGQSQGATFEQRFGLRLEQLIGQLTTDAEVVATREDEQEGRAHALRVSLSGTDKAPPPQPETVPDTPEIVVASSGNLSLVYLARLPGRVTLEQIDDRHPKLLDGLVEHPGVGWVMVRSAEHGAVVLGRNGRRRLRDGHIDGLDPLLGYGPRAAQDLIRHDGLANTGDLVINSCWDPESQEVAAFEDLIGCHGGLGGWQNRPVLIHPRSWRVPVELVGADAVHRLLCRALEETGCRPGHPSGVSPAR